MYVRGFELDFRDVFDVGHCCQFGDCVLEGFVPVFSEPLPILVLMIAQGYAPHQFDLGNKKRGHKHELGNPSLEAPILGIGNQPVGPAKPEPLGLKIGIDGPEMPIIAMHIVDEHKEIPVEQLEICVDDGHELLGLTMLEGGDQDALGCR